MKNNYVKLWNKNFIIIIVINFLIFLNHLMVLSTFPIFITDVLDGTDSISGMCATVFSLVAVIIYVFIGKNHPSSITYRIQTSRYDKRISAINPAIFIYNSFKKIFLNIYFLEK